jgi:hypothetical protein
MAAVMISFVSFVGMLAFRTIYGSAFCPFRVDSRRASGVAADAPAQLTIVNLGGLPYDSKGFRATEPYSECGMKIGTVVAAMIASTVACGAEDRPKVTFYRYGDSFSDYSMGKRKITVYCDDKEIARVEKRSYFSTYLSAGRHKFRDKKDDSRSVPPLEILAEPGAEYFVRSEWAFDTAFAIVGGWSPHLTLTDLTVFDSLFPKLKPLQGSVIFSLFKPPTALPEQQSWVGRSLVDIEHVSRPVAGTQTQDEEWIYTFKSDRYTFVASERSYRITGFRHIGIAVGDEIKYSAVNDKVFVQDATGSARQLQLIQKIKNMDANR